MGRDADPNLDFYRRAFAELQLAIGGLLREAVDARLRLAAMSEDVGVTTSDDGGVW